MAKYVAIVAFAFSIRLDQKVQSKSQKKQWIHNIYTSTFIVLPYKAEESSTKEWYVYM